MNKVEAVMGRHFKVAVVIGRHQISHIGHELLKRKALEIADQVVIVIGSSFQSRSRRNPFKWTERRDMIMSTLTESEQKRVVCVPVRDYYNDEKWNREVKRIVHEYGDQRVALVGHKKKDDKDTYYLDHFQGWDFIEVESTTSIDASVLRAIYFEAENIDVSLSVIGDQILAPIRQYLKAWALMPEYKELCAEHKKIKADIAVWGDGISNTGDAVVRINNHVLLGKRKFLPGRGLWCIPGGFLEKDERVLACALRELREETSIGSFTSTLMDGFKFAKTFDHPKRSARGRVITHAHFFDLNVKNFPETKAADDLEEVAWIHVDKLKDMEELFFDDHFHILNDFLGFL